MNSEQLEAQAIDRKNAEIELHNSSQERVVQRAQDMVKMLFLVSGGALAVCANFFSAGSKLSPSTIYPIQLAWLSLTISMLMFGLTLVLLLARDFFFGEAQGEAIETRIQQKESSPHWNKSLWISGLFGFACFAAGMGAFTYAAWIYLETSM